MNKYGLISSEVLDHQSSYVEELEKQVELARVNGEKAEQLRQERHAEYQGVLAKYEEEVVSLKAEMAEDRAKLTTTVGERDQLQGQISELAHRVENGEKLVQLRDEELALVKAAGADKDTRLSQARAEIAGLKKKLGEMEVVLGHQAYEKEEMFYSTWLTAYRCVSFSYDIDWSVVDQNLNDGVGDSRLPDEVLERYGMSSPDDGEENEAGGDQGIEVGDQAPATAVTPETQVEPMDVQAERAVSPSNSISDHYFELHLEHLFSTCDSLSVTQPEQQDPDHQVAGTEEDAHNRPAEMDISQANPDEEAGNVQVVLPDVEVPRAVTGTPSVAVEAALSSTEPIAEEGTGAGPETTPDGAPGSQGDEGSALI